jgi:DNA-binding XRE family transcriptional regulator
MPNKIVDEWVFNDLLKNERIKMNYSQETMAKKLDVSPQTISFYETKRIKPSSAVLIRFMLQFNKSIFIFDKKELANILSNQFEYAKANA